MQNLAPGRFSLNSETIGISRFSKNQKNQGTSVHVTPSDRTPSLARGRLHGKQLLAGCMKVASLAAIRERQVGRGGGGGDSPPTDSNKQLIKRNGR